MLWLWVVRICQPPNWMFWYFKAIQGNENWRVNHDMILWGQWSMSKYCRSKQLYTFLIFVTITRACTRAWANSQGLLLANFGKWVDSLWADTFIFPLPKSERIGSRVELKSSQSSPMSSRFNAMTCIGLPLISLPYGCQSCQPFPPRNLLRNVTCLALEYRILGTVGAPLWGQFLSFSVFTGEIGTYWDRWWPLRPSWIPVGFQLDA